MGFQYRKRTRGSKSGWVNFSYSKKNGLNASTSIKSGNVTYNTGNRTRGSRTTINLGNGARYVVYGKKATGEGGEIGLVWAVLIVLAAIVLISLAINYIWWTISIAVAGLIGYKLYRHFSRQRTDNANV